MIACPIPFETLVALFTGELDADAVDAVESHVFSCDRCAEGHARLAELIASTRELIPPVISAAHRDRLVAAGKRIVLTPVTPHEVPTARFAPGVDLLVHALRGDLADAERVDVELVSDSVALRFEAVPFDPVAGEVLIACQRHYEGHGPVTFRVHAFRKGRAEPVGDYFVEHVWS